MNTGGYIECIHKIHECMICLNAAFKEIADGTKRDWMKLYFDKTI